MKHLFLMLSICFFTTLTAVEQITVIYNDYAPYCYVDKNTPEGANGLCVEIIQAVAETLDIEVKFDGPYQPTTCLDLMKEGRVDALIPLTKTSEREKYMTYYDNNLIDDTISFIVRNDSDISWTGNLHSIEKHTIGVVKVFSYGETFDAASFLDLDNSEKNTDVSLLNKLLDGKLDVIIASSLVLKDIATKAGNIDKIKLLSPNVSTDPLYMAFSKAKNNDKIAWDFSNALKSFRNTSEYKKILKKYGQ